MALFRRNDDDTSQTPPGCEHFQSLVETVEPSSTVCDQCVAIDSSWVHLRSCLTCGQVGCCDYSPNRHARMHWEETGHALIRSIEPGESWQYCFQDHFVVQ